MKRRIDVPFNETLARMYPNTGKTCSTVTFQVTDACNLKCTYCYQINKGTRVMSLDTAKKFIDLLLTKDRDKNSYINEDTSSGIVLDFIGGEPLLQAKLISDIIDYFQIRTLELNHPWKDKFRASLCTNGVLYFSKDSQELFKKHGNHLAISVTVDGCKEMHDACRIFPNGAPSYDLAIAADQDLLDKDGNVGTKITISPFNVSYVYEATVNMLNLNHRVIHINCAFEEGWEIEHAQILYQQLKKVADYMLDYPDPMDIYYALFNEGFYEPMDESDNRNWCGGTGGMIACDPDGILYPCIRYMESSLGSDIPPIIVGNVDDGILFNQCQKNCMECMSNITRKSQSTEECFNCPIATGCSWCSAYNYQRFGTVNHRATFICDMHRASSLANAYFWNKYYKKFNIDKHLKIYCQKEYAIPIIGKDEYDYLLKLQEG